MHLNNTRRILGGVVLSFAGACAIGGCAGSAPAPQSAGVEATAPARAAQPAKPAAPAGTAVKKNVTTQAEMTAMFGRPINAHAAADGTETWVYERLRGTDVAGDAPQDRNYYAFFGAAFAGPAERPRAAAVRTLTVVVRFNPDKTVQDYSAVSSYF